MCYMIYTIRHIVHVTCKGFFHFGQALEAARDAGAKANALGALARAQLLGRELLKAVEAQIQWIGRRKSIGKP